MQILELLVQLPQLGVLYLQGNPCVKRIAHYRKVVVARMPKLKYLDDRPVFDEERLRAEAWFAAFQAGGLAAAKDAEKGEIERQKQEKADRDERNFRGMFRLQGCFGLDTGHACGVCMFYVQPLRNSFEAGVKARASPSLARKMMNTQKKRQAHRVQHRRRWCRKTRAPACRRRLKTLMQTQLRRCRHKSCPVRLMRWCPHAQHHQHQPLTIWMRLIDAQRLPATLRMNFLQFYFCFHR